MPSFLKELRDRNLVDGKPLKSSWAGFIAAWVQNCDRGPLITTHPVDLQAKIMITPSFTSVLVSRGDAEIRPRVNEIFLVALFEKSTFLCCYMIEAPRRHHF